MRAAYYGLDSWLFSLQWTTRVALVSSRVYRHFRILRGSQLTWYIERSYQLFDGSYRCF